LILDLVLISAQEKVYLNTHLTSYTHSKKIDR
jgi:hypothetical protein